MWKQPFCLEKLILEIFMKSPVGMDQIDSRSSPEDCYQTLKGIYGLCQAARQFWKKFVNTVKKEHFGFQVSPADPCRSLHVVQRE